MSAQEKMMEVSELIQAVNGKPSTPDANCSIYGITTDTRAIKQGDLFIALQGENFNGHDFIDTAIKAGASCVVAHKDLPTASVPVVYVKDTRLALGHLAKWWRNRFKGKLVALTGSNGKTTVKEMIASILRVAADNSKDVLATEGNFNNDIGMPLTLLKLREHHKYAVIEMGMNHLGEISYLTNIARPDVALINNAHRAHVGEVGSVENIAKAKGEIFEGLKENGTAVLNADDSFYSLWKELTKDKHQISFGLDSGEIKADYVEADYGASLKINSSKGAIDIALKVPGKHNIRNALAASAAAIALGIPPQAISQGLSSFPGTKGRLQRKPGLNGSTIMDDTYNANPDSMIAAISVLAKIDGIKIFVMGDMGELGSGADEFHAEIGKKAREANIDVLLTLGKSSVLATNEFGEGSRHFLDVQDLIQALVPLLNSESIALIKGSRFMKMERVVEAVLEKSKK